MTRYLTYIDGSIEFIKRGLPPTEVPGFEVDPGNPYIFRPILPPCKRRTTVKVPTPCCPEGKEVVACEKFGFIYMTPQCCINCDKDGKSEP